MSNHSRFLSLVLRHKPEVVNITLDKNGWVNVDVLLKSLKNLGKDIDREALEEIVATNNKKRFAFSEDGTKIRASQGHSVNVDLKLEAKTPPYRLFHGTSSKSLNSIFSSSLNSGSRQHVHLSRDKDTAMDVGERHGKAVILEVDSLQMQKDGYKFYLSENGVWLTDNVPTKYLEITDIVVDGSYQSYN